MKKNKKNIVLTGGHAGTTAIALVEELRARKEFKDNYEIYWIGAKSSVEGRKTKPIELSVMPELGVKVEQITAGRLQRKFTFWTLPSLFKIPLSFLNAFMLLLKIKPKIIVSFGGYVAYPIVLAGKIMRIKSILHEQTVAAGRSNIYSAKITDKIALGRAESKKFFPQEKTTVTGNPLMKNIERTKSKENLSDTPVIFITLGSRGSLRINEIVGNALPKLLTKYKIIHLTGELDFDNFIVKKTDLEKKLKKNYEVFSTISPLEIHKLYEKADIVIGRAGANTVSEIMYLKIPSIFIPIPFSFQNEQFKNAKFAESFGIARILEEKDLSPDSLINRLDLLIKDWKEIKRNVQCKEGPDINGSKNLADLLIENL